uniref:Uncharacterized protein n=1 Tax=Anguilla anguilla TaxID=7936 RepID=A0A0E9UBV7_ANGAN
MYFLLTINNIKCSFVDTEEEKQKLFLEGPVCFWISCQLLLLII